MSISPRLRGKSEMTQHPRSVPAGHRKTRGTKKGRKFQRVLLNTVSVNPWINLRVIFGFESEWHFRKSFVHEAKGNFSHLLNMIC